MVANEDNYKSITNLINKVYLPQALSIGVDYKDFWELTPKKLQPFVKAKEQELQLQTKMVNYEAWLNGLYIRQAIASVFSKNGKYPEKPIETGSTDSNSQNTEMDFKAKFEVWAAIHNEKYKK
mgnify:FL=1